MKRKSGYYWVKYNSKWIIAEYKDDGFYSRWMECGTDYTFDDSEIEEIDESQIERKQCSKEK